MKLITAHDLLSGEVVYLNAEGMWSRSVADAVAFADEDAQARLKTIDPTAVVNAYLIEAEADGLPAKRVRLREAIRAEGPTVRRDLGKQAASVS